MEFLGRDDISPYWERDGFQLEALGYRVENGYLVLGELQDQPPSGGTETTETSDESFEWSLAYMILRRAGAVGILTTSELYDTLITLFSMKTWIMMSTQDKLRKLPNKLVKVLGWDKGNPFALPLARAICEYLGEEIQNGDELEFVQGMEGNL